MFFTEYVTETKIQDKPQRNFTGKVKKIFRNNLLQICMLAIILVKSIIFLGIIGSRGASGFNIDSVFYGTFPGIGIYISFAAILLSFSYLLKGKYQLWFFILFDLIFTAIMLADTWYYRGFGSFISLYLLKQTTNLENLSGSVISMGRPIDVVFIVDIVVISYMSIKYREVYLKSKRNVILFVTLITICVIFITSVHYKVDIIEKGKHKILFRICWTPNQTMSNLSPIGYHIYDTYKYWSDSKQYKLSNSEKDEIITWYENKKENIPDNQYKGIFKDKNLIIIQVESLENFVINQKINKQEITPNINKLLGNSMYFNNYFEQVYNGTSSDADLMTNASVFPVRTGSTFFRYPGNTYNSLPKLLEELGYSTTAIHADKGSYWNWMPALKSMGFNECIDASYFKQDESIGLGLSDGSFFKQVVPIIKTSKQPFYTFLVTLTSHGPFDLPKKYRELVLDESLDSTKLGGYFQSIHYVDKQIGSFLNELSKNNILDDSVIVIYGDHTGIHKYYEDEVSKIKPSEEWWTSNNQRIPLLIYQNKRNGQVISTFGGQVDLLPTISYLMGINENQYLNTAMGRNLLKTNKNFTVLANRKLLEQGLSKQEQEAAVRAIDLSDIMIRSDYFKK